MRSTGEQDVQRHNATQLLGGESCCIRTAGAALPHVPLCVTMVRGTEERGDSRTARLYTPSSLLRDYTGIRTAFFRSDGLLQSRKG